MSIPSGRDRDDTKTFFKLGFFDNFESSIIQVSIPPMEEVSVPNPFRDKRVPRYYLVLFCNTENPVTGDTPWSGDFLSFYNPLSGDTVEATILLLR